MKLGKPPRDSDAGEQRITLRLSSLAFGGDAVGRDDEGRVTFVAGGARAIWCGCGSPSAKKRTRAASSSR